jgi:hypothetical protein
MDKPAAASNPNLHTLGSGVIHRRRNRNRNRTQHAHFARERIKDNDHEV